MLNVVLLGLTSLLTDVSSEMLWARAISVRSGERAHRLFLWVVRPGR